MPGSVAVLSIDKDLNNQSTFFVATKVRESPKSNEISRDYQVYSSVCNGYLFC